MVCKGAEGRPSRCGKGDVQSQYVFALMHTRFHGVPQDAVEAMKWIRKAAEQGHADAQFNLGAIYANGEGIPEDYVEAYAWWSVAATNGNKLAKQDLTKAKVNSPPTSSVTRHQLFEQINARKAK